MIDQSTSLAARERPSARSGAVGIALVLLWLAWLVSAAALFTNQVVFSGRGIGPGPALGTMSLVMQAVALAFVQRGNRPARAITIAFALIAALPTAMIPRLLAERAFTSAGYVAVSFVLKACGACLLLTPNGAKWFGRT
jgi:hypothetical protein